MANIDAVRGAKPVMHLDGSPYNGAFNRYYVPASDSTAIFVGDFVKSAGSSDADGVPDVAQAAAGNAILGCVVGIEPVTDESLIYRAASTARYVYVADAPDLVFEMQEDSVGNNIAVTQIGNNFDIVVAAGSTARGASGMEIDSSDTSGTSTAQLRVLRLDPRPDNEIGNYAKWLVMVNEHERKSATGT